MIATVAPAFWLASPAIASPRGGDAEAGKAIYEERGSSCVRCEDRSTNSTAGSNAERNHCVTR